MSVSCSPSTSPGRSPPSSISSTIARSRSRVRLSSSAPTSGSVIGRGNLIGSRTRTVRRTGCWRLAPPANGWWRAATRASAGSKRRCIGFSPSNASADIAHSKKLDTAASARATVAGASSRPCATASDNPSR